MKNQLCILLTIIIGQINIPLLSQQDSFLVSPYLQFATQTSIHILWETRDSATTEVSYGIAREGDQTANLENSIAVEGVRTMHEVMLTGLQPETNYFWQVTSKDKTGKVLSSEVLTFKSAVNDSSAVMFALIGDTQRNNDTPWAWGKIAPMVYRERPHFVVHVGDLVDKGLNKSDWTEHFFPNGRKLMERVPIYPVLGNHEQNSPLYYQYIVAPEPEYYYTFHYGNIQFFMLDSNRDIDEGSEQYDWLEWELSKSTAKWKIAVHHHPPYTSDNNDYGDTALAKSKLGSKTRNLVPLYDRYGLDFCLYGHTHLYERSWPMSADRISTKDGVIYINSGGAGGYIEDFAPTRSWFTKELEAIHHYCTFNIFGDELVFKAIDHEGRLIDAFQMTKLHKSKVSQPPTVKVETTGLLFEDKSTVTLSSAFDDVDIYYTLDGHNPTSQSTKYKQAFTVNKTSTLKAVAITKDDKTSRIKVVSFRRSTPQKATLVKNKQRGLHYQYYEGEWSSLPDFSKLPIVERGNTRFISLDQIKHQEDHFGLIFEGYVDISESGIKTFFINSDDGSKLYINDELLIDHDHDHSAIAKTGQTILEAGLHKIRVEYFEAKGSQYLQAGMLDIDQKEIPFSPFQLYHNADGQ